MATAAPLARLHLMRSLALLALCACTQKMGADPSSVQPTVPSDAAIDAAVDAGVASCVDGTPYDEAVLRERVAFLASPELGGRVPGSEGDRQARAFLVEQFRCLGLVPAFGTEYEQPFLEAGKATANVVGVVPGGDPALASEIIMVAAHHDHLGDGHLGANDNASGTVALLAVAQAIRQRATPPKRTIVFAAFGAEETGMHGSYFYARNAPAALPVARMVQVINLDMVGSHASRGVVAALGTFRGLVATKLLAKLDDKYKRVHVSYGGRARGSDFEPFCKQGVPYAFFWTPDARCYHRTCDTADQLDYPRMRDIAALAGDLTEAMGDTSIDLADARAKRGCGI